MKDIKSLLKTETQKYGILLDDKKLDNFQLYLEELLKTNEYMNLTAITDPDEVAIKHFLDSLLLLNVCSPKEGALFADVGTGAGFPGLPVKIARNDIKLYLIDSLNKRLVFLQELVNKMGLCAETVHSRAEDLGRDTEFRGRFDYVTARAVANLSTLSEYCLPLLKKDGVFVAMKSLKAEEEIAQAKNAISVLGGRVEEVKTLNIGDDITRTFIVIRKEKETSAEYPRKGVKIAKNPL